LLSKHAPAIGSHSTGIPTGAGPRQLIGIDSILKNFFGRSKTKRKRQSMPKKTKEKEAEDEEEIQSVKELSEDQESVEKSESSSSHSEYSAQSSDDDEKLLIKQAMAKQTQKQDASVVYQQIKRRLMKRHEIVESDHQKIAKL
jgi:hypothetical protein